MSPHPTPDCVVLSTVHSLNRLGTITAYDRAARRIGATLRLLEHSHSTAAADVLLLLLLLLLNEKLHADAFYRRRVNKIELVA